MHKKLRATCAKLAALAIVLGALSPACAEATSMEETQPQETVQEATTAVETEEASLPATEPTTVPQETEPAATEPEETTEAVDPPMEETSDVPARNIQVPVFYQTDYPDVLYSNGTIATDGCSITCLAMVATYMTGHVSGDHGETCDAASVGGNGAVGIQHIGIIRLVEHRHLNVAGGNVRSFLHGRIHSFCGFLRLCSGRFRLLRDGGGLGGRQGGFFRFHGGGGLLDGLLGLGLFHRSSFGAGGGQGAQHDGQSGQFGTGGSQLLMQEYHSHLELYFYPL